MKAAKTILISGGTGLVGTALTKFLKEGGWNIIVLTRNPNLAYRKFGNKSGISFAAWDIKKGTIDAHAVASADALVHLAGSGIVDKPWTEAYRREIRESRVNSSRLLVQAIRDHGSKLTTVVSASAIGWYGADDPEHMVAFTEDMPAAPGFLGETCLDWENSIKPVMELDKRLIICRFGIVLSNHGGALREFKKPLAFRVAGILGSGSQIVSWIHISDLCGIIQFAIEQENLQGVYNAVAPHPVSNKVLNLALAECIYGKGFMTMPVPEIFLKIFFGERSAEVLKSTTVSAEKILSTGFAFQFPDIHAAVKNLASGK